MVTTQALMGAAITLSVVLSMLGVSSPQAVWTMVNHFQLLLLMPMTGAYFPSEIIEYLTGMSISMFNFYFIPFPDIPFIDTIYSYFSFKQENEYFVEIGIEHGSSLLDNLPILSSLIINALLHVPLAVLYNKIADNNSDKSERTIWRKVVCKLFNVFTFSLYVRTLIEAFQVMLLSSIQEIKVFSFTPASRGISVICALALLLL